MAGGDLEGVIETAANHRLPLERGDPDRDRRCARDWSSPTRSGIVHRDLKPGNVWLTEDGGPCSATSASPWRSTSRA